MAQLTESPLDYFYGASLRIKWSLGDATESGVFAVTLECHACSSLVCRTVFVLTHHAQVYCEKFIADLLGQLFLGHRPLQLRRRGVASMGHAL